MTGQVEYRQIFSYFPPEDRLRLERLPQTVLDSLREIRIRAGRPASLVTGQGVLFLQKQGGCRRVPEGEIRIFSAEEVQQLFRAFCQDSVHSFEGQLRQGFLTLPGGHRVGLSGTAVMEGNRIFSIRDISSLDIRIARQVSGAAEPLLQQTFCRDGLGSLLLAGAPGTGKTTLLRDLARSLGNGRLGRFLQVAVIDERGELAASLRGEPQYDVGCCTDVYHLCPKVQGMNMAIRSAAPELLICDEIGGEDAAQALLDGMRAGVCTAASVHGDCLEELYARPGIRTLLENGAFRWVAFLQAGGRPGRLRQVISLQGKGGREYALSCDSAAGRGLLLGGFSQKQGADRTPSGTDRMDGSIGTVERGALLEASAHPGAD